LYVESSKFEMIILLIIKDFIPLNYEILHINYEILCFAQNDTLAGFILLDTIDTQVKSSL